ncbi:hypothetical protein DXG03_001263 [Asterophora parasitica]|uniref:non-specific serine/threonine protein kinase n=1 Tax=Asterophora parasitica TaxID=117018 RepID=A0A9P7G473_9AGAR|nr:hypothetical protein DXG03_001263 [Asterophora parasitica]
MATLQILEHCTASRTSTTSTRSDTHVYSYPAHASSPPNLLRLTSDSLQPDGTVFVDLEFVEEALGLPGVDGYGWARFEFGQAIGPNNRYTIQRKLGWGMYSSTWLARDNEESKYVAVKALTGYSTELHEKGLAYWEPQALHFLGNSPPHCIPLLAQFNEVGIGEDGPHRCLVTPLYGGDVSALLKGHKGVPLRLSKLILLHILRGIAHAHSCSIVHTDLKPDNFFFEATMTTAEIEKWLEVNPPRRNPPEMSKHEMIQSAVSQPLPMISVEDAQTIKFSLYIFGY